MAQRVKTEFFQTATIARLYAKQGKLAKARKLYDDLLANNPEDSQLQSERHHLVQQLSEGRLLTPQNSIELRLDKGRLHCSYVVSDDSFELYRKHHSPNGRLNLRITTFKGEVGDKKNGLIVDVEATSSRGAASIPVPHHGYYSVASIGIMTHDNRHVSIAHSELVQL